MALKSAAPASHPPAASPAPIGGRTLTTGSIPRNLWFLAWPATVSGALHTVDLLMEIVWAGFLGTHAIGSIGVAQGWVQLFNTARMGLDASTRAMVSRAVGAGDHKAANHAAMQSLLLNVSLALVILVIGSLLAYPLLRVIGVSDAIAEEGASYLRWRFISTTTFAVLMVTMSILQAAGDPITPMKANMVSRVIHMAVSPFLIFGWGLPAMGIAGSAAGFAIAQVVGVAITAQALFAPTARFRLSFRNVSPDLPLMGRMLRIGLPASVTNGERSLAQLLLIGIVAPFGDVALAAYSLVQRLQSFVNLGLAGLAQAAGVLANQNLGAQQVDRARAAANWAVVFTVLLCIVVGILFFVFPIPLLHLFTRDEALVATGAAWLKIMVVGFLFMGIADVFMHVLNTAGDTMLPMVVSLLSIWLVQQPAALFLSGQTAGWVVLGQPLPVYTGLDDLGVAWAMVAALVFRLMIYWPYFQWAPWWKKKL
ncbi:MAG: MATE family efflux transporter [Chloroflexota bacterium]